MVNSPLLTQTKRLRENHGVLFAAFTRGHGRGPDYDGK